jgi:hypothetical protein
MSKSKDNTRFFKPGMEGGVFYVKRKNQSDFEIGPHGVAVRDSDLLDTLDEHPLKGDYIGFYEVDSLAAPKVITTQASDDDTPVIPGEEAVDALSIPETKAAIKDQNLSDEEIIALTKGDDRKGIQDIHDAARERLEEADNEDDEDNKEETVIKDDITNINQLKDFISEQDGVDGRSLTTPDKILAAAKQLDPPHEFPNLQTGG